MPVFVCVGAHCGQKRTLAPLELKLQAVVGHLIGVPGTKLGSLEEQPVFFPTKPSVQPSVPQISTSLYFESCLAALLLALGSIWTVCGQVFGAACIHSELLMR